MRTVLSVLSSLLLVLFLWVAVAAVLPAAAAECTVGGTISVDSTWSPGDCDAYIVTSNIAIDTDATLTIQAGTIVKFNPLMAIEVNGTLVAKSPIGGVPITFTANEAGQLPRGGSQTIETDCGSVNIPANPDTPTPGSWGYIRFTDTSVDAQYNAGGNYISGSIIQNAVIEGGGGASLVENGSIIVDNAAPFLNANTIQYSLTDAIHVYNDGFPRITNNTIVYNISRGIWALTDNPISIKGNTVNENTAVGIYTLGTGLATIANNTVMSNTCTLGAGVHVQGPAWIEGNTISGNRGESGGGAIYTIFEATILDNILENNSSPTGGAIHNKGNATIRKNTIIGNSADESGGGIYSTGVVTITGNTILSNVAVLGGGGGIYISGTATIDDNSIKYNEAADSGGGIFNWNVTLAQGNTIAYNDALGTVGLGYGGGIYSRAGLLAQHNIIYGNTASQAGGGLYLIEQAQIKNNTISFNSAGSRGGGVYGAANARSAGVVNNNAITHNTAGEANRGGGVACDRCGYAVRFNTFIANMTGPDLDITNALFNGNWAGSPALEAMNNYWGSNDAGVIPTYIWDFFDDSALAQVEWDPWHPSALANYLVNGNFESGSGLAWSETAANGQALVTTILPAAGVYGARLCGYDNCNDSIEQLITLGDDARLKLLWHMNSSEGAVGANDSLKIELYNLDGSLFSTIATITNEDTRDTWVNVRLNLKAFAHETVYLRITAESNSSLPTTFYVDELTIR